MDYVIVTGAAGGIGQALVKTFADAGYAVIATDRDEQPENLPCTHYLQIDLAQTVTDESYANQQFSLIRQHLAGNRLYALINNAAVQVLGGVDSLTREDWGHTLNVNLLAPFLWTQAFLTELEAARGSVINISSIHAKLTKKNFVAYASSKAALSGMTRAMAVDLQGRVRVNAIEPAAIETPMLKAGFQGKPELYAQLEACHPQGRIGSANEVANLCLSVAGTELDFINGACLALDGGISSRLFDPD